MDKRCRLRKKDARSANQPISKRWKTYPTRRGSAVSRPFAPPFLRLVFCRIVRKRVAPRGPPIGSCRCAPVVRIGENNRIGRSPRATRRTIDGLAYRGKYRPIALTARSTSRRDRGVLAGRPRGMISPDERANRTGRRMRLCTANAPRRASRGAD